MFVGGTGSLVAPFIKATTDERRLTVATHAAFMSWQHGVKNSDLRLIRICLCALFAINDVNDSIGYYRYMVGKKHLNQDAKTSFPPGFQYSANIIGHQTNLLSCKAWIF